MDCGCEACQLTIGQLLNCDICRTSVCEGCIVQDSDGVHVCHFCYTKKKVTHYEGCLPPDSASLTDDVGHHVISEELFPGYISSSDSVVVQNIVIVPHNDNPHADKSQCKEEKKCSKYALPKYDSFEIISAIMPVDSEEGVILDQLAEVARKSLDADDDVVVGTKEKEKDEYVFIDTNIDSASLLTTPCVINTVLVANMSPDEESSPDHHIGVFDDDVNDSGKPQPAYLEIIFRYRKAVKPTDAADPLLRKSSADIHDCYGCFLFCFIH